MTVSQVPYRGDTEPERHVERTEPPSADAERFAVMRVSPQVFVDFCKAGHPRRVRVVAHALPDDATFVRAGHDGTGDLLVVLWSRAFAVVARNARYPELPPTEFQIVREDT